ncbi:hypothetical protein J3R30DRAFT_3456152 [Lentinula aciculospora]|uniref:SET domain-containing protein n=1 Tax=Lentinula aciculospora TaxID=153920 RepID=A0A9W9DQZ9_9AGAR|nr:hypothetical protein J3R30DRAFT_3456152 [Lentinula aciculospora]
MLSDSEAKINLAENVYLEPQAVGRSRCMANTTFSAGSIILSNRSFVNVLLPSEKGHRCDHCHYLSSPGSLKRCTGCVSFYYCDQICQSKHWKSGHRKICRLYNSYTSTPSFQALEEHKKMDALLLSSLVAHTSSVDANERDEDTAFTTFKSLLPGPMAVLAPPICPRYTFSAEVIDGFYARFENNNFSIHSHFKTYAHGIFPLASRLFNHSCMPNAAVKFIIQVHEPVRLEVVALRAISKGDEICIPYLDPALLQTRTTVFDLTYGFTCSCSSCSVVRKVGIIPELPEDPVEFQAVCKRLREFVKAMGLSPFLTSDDSLFPRDLACVLHESFISTLSEQFSAASHDGHYDVALESSTSLFALYQLIYPPNYPQIGLHLLEKAKTCWNHIVSSTLTMALAADLENSVVAAKEIFTIIGQEGDPEDGPLVEIETLLEAEKSL